jgi:hypothetical protein
MELVTILLLPRLSQKKKIDSVYWEALWQLLRYYEITIKLANIIKKSLDRMNCRMIHKEYITKSFSVKTGVRQERLLLPFSILC